MSVGGVHVGFIGQLHPSIINACGLPDTSYLTYAQVELDTIATVPTHHKEPSFETLQDQILYRDLCFVLDQSVSYQVLWDAVKTVEEVKDIQVFDLYAGDKLTAGKKSCAFSIKLQ